MFGAVWAQAELRKVLGALGARVVDRELPLTLGDDAWHESGALASADQREALAEHVGALLGAARGQRGRARAAPAGGVAPRMASARPASCAGRR